ncbi:pilus assembly protein CpaF [Aurantimicrobium sp. INA4]|uniref:CpaF family protein n=1 Tax=Aurantimicrobium sp. INA4 TaxID=2986279 RepID=UPI0024932348|nr:ATPase, T2SS/T4P/T4SS family [Aurantimicrobium sp. INA4]BDU11211.1 pilus assembly protein CpaF [Aurantimicrobium sp. INA4]
MSDSISRIVGAVRAKAHDSVAAGATSTEDLEKLLRNEIVRNGVHNSGEPLTDTELHSLAMAELAGFGPLQAFLDDPSIEEIWINSPTQVFVARYGVAELTDLSMTNVQVRDLVERMLQTSGRRVDMSSPFVDASLPDGSRLHVTIPDITSQHWAVNIRKFSHSVRDLSDLVEGGSLTRQAGEFLRMSVLARQNILVCGATQAGKTTMLNALLRSSRENERIITVEETFELNFGARDCVAMQCRQASLEGTGEITLRRLIKEALRMRPDRLVVGEVREAESLDLLIALNSGLPGACSLHANSAHDALTKLCTLPLLAGRNIDASFVVPTVASCIDVVVHCELDRFGRRRVSEIISPTGRIIGGEIETTTIFEIREDVLVATGEAPARLDKFELTNLNPRIVLDAA